MYQFLPAIATAVIVLLFFIWKGKSQSKFGINLKRVICPVCKTKQPVIRMPHDLQQSLWGGTICPKCGTRLDKYGNIIS